MHLSFFVAFSILQLFGPRRLDGAEISDNEIIGPLNVTCQGGSALVNFKTKNPFNGRVYVKGAYAKPQCNHDFSNGYGSNSQLEMPFGDCDMQKKPAQGLDSGRAFKYVSLIVISFHPKFITKGDKAYRIECLYKTVDAEVEAELNISELTTQSIVFRPPPPLCQYSIHSGSPNGPEAKYVKVGDSLFHKWNCDSGNFALFVHSCYVNGPGQEQIELLDDDGCALDIQIMPNLTYSKTMNDSWVETRAFRYQEVESMRFNCKISTCLKADTVCIESWPHKCFPLRRKRDSSDKKFFNDQVIYSPFVHLSEPFNEFSEEIHPVEDEVNPPQSMKSICFDRPAVAIWATATILLFCSVLAAAVVVIKKMKRF